MGNAPRTKTRFFPKIHPDFANISKHVCTSNTFAPQVFTARSCAASGGGLFMKSREYRSKAVECLKSAPWVGDVGAKNALIEMALYWLRLADLNEANHDRDGAIDRAAKAREPALPL